MLDVKKASGMLIQELDKVALEIKNEKGLDNSKSAPDIPTHKEPTYYTTVAYFQSTNDTQLFDRLLNQGDYKRILAEAAEYDNGDAPDLTQTYKSPIQNRGDDLLNEDYRYAVVYNASIGGTYEVFRKLSEEQVRRDLTHYGLPNNATKDVYAIAETMPEFQNKEREESVTYRMRR